MYKLHFYRGIQCIRNTLLLSITVIIVVIITMTVIITGDVWNWMFGQIVTDDYLRVKSDPSGHAFAIGDCADIDSYPLPCTAQVLFLKLKKINLINHYFLFVVLLLFYLCVFFFLFSLASVP